jgi:hypothetical protein
MRIQTPASTKPGAQQRVHETRATPSDPGVAISDLNDFLTTTLARQIKAEEAHHNAFHNRDPTP